MQPTSRAEADRLLGIAENLLDEKDRNAARDFALLAQETEPLNDGSDQILAITDVLIAAEKRITDHHHHWYDILHINVNRAADAEFVKNQYRSLALLLRPHKRKFSSSEYAFKLVNDAWSVLSDPGRKMAYDKDLFEFLKVDLETAKNQGEIEIQNRREKIPLRRTTDNLWTMCPYCYHLYEYPRAFDGCCLRCQKCDRAFQVIEIPTEAMPVMVPGREAYYCSRSYFPIRFTISDSTPNRMPSKTSSPLDERRHEIS